VIPALALVAGLLVALSLPPWGWWPLSFVGVALFAGVLDARGGTAPPRRRFLYGLLFGIGWLAPAMAWMWFLSAPGYVAATLVFASLHGLAEVVAPATGRWRVIGRPAAHTLVEALRFSFPFGGVPLASLAIAQAAGPLAPIVRVGGAILLTWVVFQVGFSLGTRVTAARSLRRPALDLTPLWGLVGAAAVLVLAFVAPQGHGTGQVLRIAAVQGGGPQGTHAIDTDAREVVERHLAATRAISTSADLDMVVWPENVIDVASFATSQELVEVTEQAERLGVPVLVGITEDAGDAFVNAQVVVLPSGEVSSRYEKVRRVPFGEYMPLRGLLAAIGAPVDRVPRDARSGIGPAVLETPAGTMAVVISWEVFFGGRVREGVTEGGGVILNPTNGSSYTGTILQTQQVASSRLRGLESGRWVVQVSPTGFSTFVSPDADVIDRTAVSEQAVIIHDVEVRGGLTWYHRIGDLPVILAALATLVLTIVATRRAASRSSA
jgi:apolipoprotein N-acyltransferase